MKDMDKAVERVERAVRNREKIMVYGDYDVDGTTAVALVYKFLRQIGHKDLLFYIPDRYTEGTVSRPRASTTPHARVRR